jgi:hypothetical protein
VVDVAALLVGLVLGLVAGALFSGLCFWLLRAFPLREVTPFPTRRLCGPCLMAIAGRIADKGAWR